MSIHKTNLASLIRFSNKMLQCSGNSDSFFSLKYSFSWLREWSIYAVKILEIRHRALIGGIVICFCDRDLGTNIHSEFSRRATKTNLTDQPVNFFSLAPSGVLG